MSFTKRPSSAEVYDEFYQTADSSDLSRLIPSNSVHEPWSLGLPQGVKYWGLSSNGEAAAFLFKEKIQQFQLHEPKTSPIETTHGLSLSSLTGIEMHVAGLFALVMGRDKKSNKLEVPSLLHCRGCFAHANEI